MDPIYLHYAIAQEYNVTRKPALVRFVQNYDGEIKYIFSKDYVVEIQDKHGYTIGIHSCIRISS
jgi:hypothetical protein